MSPGEVLDKHTSRELTEWQVYLQMYPQGAVRGDLQAGIIASTVANAHRGKDGRRFKPDDFMPKFGSQQKEQTEEEIQMNAQLLGQAFGGKMGKLSGGG